MKKLLVLLTAVVALGGCGNDEGTPFVLPDGSTDAGNPFTCESLTAAPPGCGSSCVGDFGCDAGLFCTNGSCIATCGAEDPCPEGEQCDSRGRCFEIPEDGGTGDGGSCIDDEVTPTRIVPNIMFLVDRSGSMTGAFGGSTRWEVAHDAIVAVVGETEGIARFGLTTYHSKRTESPPGTEVPDPMCPRFDVEVDFTLAGAESAIDTALPDTFPGLGSDNTPTGDSVNKLVTQIQLEPPPADGPTVIVLATDGLPDTCEQPNPNEGQAEAIAAVQAAYLEDLETFALSVGPDVGEEHLQDIACAGVGIDPVSASCTPANAPFWIGTNPALLEQHFRTIITSQISCELELNGIIEDFDRVCEGEVELDGVPIACVHGQSCTSGPGSNCDGWRIKDGTNDTLELLGQACEDWKEGAEGLTAVFPCGIIVVE